MLLMFLNLYKKAIEIFWNKEGICQIISFSIIGCIGTVLNIGVIYILTEYLFLRYIFSSLIGQIIGITNNFFMNKYFTFKKKGGSTKKQYMLSLIIYGFSTMLSLSMIYLLTDYLHLWYMYSILIVIPVVIIINFLGHKFIVFKK